MESSTDYVRIFDTTLRDGEQSPGATMTRDREAGNRARARTARRRHHRSGLPRGLARTTSRRCATSPSRSGRSDRAPVICGLARASKKDIDAAWEGVRSAIRPRIHTFLATSELHMQHKLRMTRDEVLERGAQIGAHARKLCGDVEFSAEDAGRSDAEFLWRVVETAVARRGDYGEHPRHRRLHDAGRVRRAHRRHRRQRAEPRRRRAERALPRRSRAGDRQHARGAARGRAPGGGGDQRHRRARRQLRARRGGDGAGTRACRCTSCARASTRRSWCAPRGWWPTCTGFPVPPNKPIVGANAFAHESGHPPGRHAQELGDVRDHAAGDGRRRRHAAGARQALGAARLRRAPRRARLHARRGAARRGVRALQAHRRAAQGA